MAFAMDLWQDDGTDLDALEIFFLMGSGQTVHWKFGSCVI